MSVFAGRLMPWLMLAVFGFAVVSTRAWQWEARFLPYIVGSVALVLAVLELGKPYLRILRKWFPSSRVLDLSVDIDQQDRTFERKAAAAFGWFTVLFASIIVLGFHIAVVVFLVWYLRREAAASWRSAFTYAAAVSFILFVAFDRILHIPWPEPYALKLLSVLMQ